MTTHLHRIVAIQSLTAALAVVALFLSYHQIAVNRDAGVALALKIQHERYESAMHICYLNRVLVFLSVTPSPPPLRVVSTRSRTAALAVLVKRRATELAYLNRGPLRDCRAFASEVVVGGA